MSECLQAEIIAGVIAVIGLGFSFGSVYLTYQLAMSTLRTQVLQQNRATTADIIDRLKEGS
jgi:hypothetical protein